MTSDNPNRTGLVIEEIQTQLAELSGLQRGELDPAATFLELGFDSLFLAQANGVLKRRFGVRLSVRQLMEKTPTIATLASHLEEKLPDDFFKAAPTAPAPPPAAPTQAAAAPQAPAPGRQAPQANVPAPLISQDAAGSGLQALIQQQLLLMQEQLQWLSGAAGAAAPAPAVAAPSAAPSTPAQSTETPAAPQSSSGTDERGRTQGPWRPADKVKDRKHGEGQRHAIDVLSEVVASKCPTSKAYAQENRRTLADPRGVTGFKSDWKDLVFQIVADRAKGARIWDVDGNEYVDMVGSYGVNFLGHSPDYIEREVKAQLESGFAIGPQTPLAGEVAALVAELTGMERVTFCNTGSEAVLAALRVARTVTGNDRIATFSGHYHGIFDEVLLRTADIGGTRQNFPIAPGIPDHAVETGLVLDYGDPASLDRIREHADELACVILEPVRSRNPDLQPWDFVRELRALTTELGIPLIFDEMITGFRCHLGGAQALLGIQADLATYGKVVAGGYPIGVVAGKAEYMDALDGGYWSYADDSVPEADMTWFAGTFVRHPVSMAAAKGSLTFLKEQGPGLQQELNDRNAAWVADMNAWFEANNVPIWLEHFSSFFLVTYTQYQEYSDLLTYYLLKRGIYSRETRPLFWSIAHSEEDWERVATAYKESVLEMQAAGLLTGRNGEIVPMTPELERFRLTPPVKTIPLTEPQREVWLGTRFGDEASSAFNLSIKLPVRGALDADAMRHAIQRLVARHEALRVTIDDEGETQHVHPELELEVPVIDLSDVDVEEREARADALEHEEVTTPFDLAEGPLVRARIVRLGDDRWRVLILAHHIITDGWSLGVLSRDLGQLYGEATGETPELKPVMQLSEYVRHLESEEEREEQETARSFWVEEYATLPPALELPTDRPRPPVKTYGADRLHLQVQPEFVRRVKAAAAKQGATLFAYTFAAFDAYLHRLTGQEDLVVGFDLAGQALVPGRDLVCHAVSFMPLRMTVDGDAPFAKLVGDMRSKLFDVMENQRCTYGTILQYVRVPPDPSRQPLVTVSFNLDPSSLGLDFPGLDVVPDSIPRQFENNDLFVNLVQLDDGGIELQCTYNLDLFEEATVQRRMEEFLELLSDAAERPDAAVRELGVVPQSELRKIEGWNATTKAYPADATLHGLVEEQALRTPDALAVAAPDAGVAEALTFAELARRADALAARLQSMDVGRGVPVAIAMDRSAELVVSLLAVLKSGGAYLPVDPTYPLERQAFMIEDSGTPLVLTQRKLVDRLPGSVASVAVDDIWAELDNGAKPEPIASPDDLAYVIYTSGSTGKPKGAMIEHRSIVNRLLWMQDYFALDESDVVLQKTPYSFDVSVWEFFWPLLAGARLVMARPEGHKDPVYLSRAVREHAVTTMHFVPSMLQVFLEEPGVDEIRSLKRVICSGEALSPSLRDRFFERLPGPGLFNLYGPTEAAVDVSVWECSVDGPDWTVPIGRPVANTQLHILDDRMAPVPVGVPGELFIGGVQVGRGYLNRDELTRERFLQDPFREGGRLYRTGDRARWNAEGAVEFLGRLDHQVKVRGFRIELGEIETAIEAEPGVQQAVVMVQEVTPGDPVLVAYVVPEDVETGGVRNALGEKLPEYMIPRHWVNLDEMPVSPNGKVARKELPLPDRPVSDARAYRAPETDTQKELARIWSDVLGVDKVGLQDDFFDLGGHSILATRVVSRVRAAFGIELPLRRIFIDPTLHGLGEQIDTLVTAVQVAGNGVDPDIEEEVVF